MLHTQKNTLDDERPGRTVYYVVVEAREAEALEVRGARRRLGARVRR